MARMNGHGSHIRIIYIWCILFVVAAIQRHSKVCVCVCVCLLNEILLFLSVCALFWVSLHFWYFYFSVVHGVLKVLRAAVSEPVFYHYCMLVYVYDYTTRIVMFFFFFLSFFHYFSSNAEGVQVIFSYGDSDHMGF